MNCFKGFKIQSKRYSNISYTIPCRYCINCRIENRKMWENRANYEFQKHITGTFITLTYDEEWLAKKCIKKGNDNELRASLNYDDVRKFIENIRKYCKDNPEYNNLLRQKDFTYIGCGEYGENGTFNRPHWHILLFGMDAAYNKKLYETKWKYGLIDIKPILNGGIRYILKYMEKQIKGKQKRWEYYRRWNLEEPKLIHSKGLGAELYYKNYENIKKNNGVIKSGQKYITVPTYYKNKMGIITNERKINRLNYEKLNDRNEKIENANNFWNDKDYQRVQIDTEIKLNKINKIKNENEIIKAQNKGIAVDYTDNI